MRSNVSSQNAGRIVERTRSSEETCFDSFDEFVGQGLIRTTLQNIITSAKAQLTIIAMTDTPALIPPSVARAFTLVFRFREYSAQDLEAIVQQMARKSDLRVDPKSSQVLAALACGLPLRALQLLRQWSHLTSQRGGNLSSSDALARLSQMTQDHQIITEGLELEQAPTTVNVKELIRQLGSRVEEQLVNLQARIDDLKGKVDELFGT